MGRSNVRQRNTARGAQQTKTKTPHSDVGKTKNLRGGAFWRAALKEQPSSTALKEQPSSADFTEQPSSAAFPSSHLQQLYLMSSCCCWGWWSSFWYHLAAVRSGGQPFRIYEHVLLKNPFAALSGKLSNMSGPQAETLPRNIDMLNRGKYKKIQALASYLAPASAFKASQPMHPRYWSWFHQRCNNFEGNRRPLYPLHTWSYCTSLWYARCRGHAKTGK